MPRRKISMPAELDLSETQYYFSRELSWLEFNNRVLNEAFDPRTPLLERLKFLAIFSSNLDEYFMVRVAALKQQVEAQVTKRSPDGRTAQEQLDLIRQRLHPMVSQAHLHFDQALRPPLSSHGIYLLDYIDLNQEQRTYFQQYFDEQIFPVLTPLAIDPSHPFPYISNLSLNLAVVMKEGENGKELFARVKVPKILPRFLTLPETLRHQQKNVTAIWTGVPLEQVIAHNLAELFPGMDIQEYHPFRVTRDSDLMLVEDDADDLLLAIEQELHKRRVGGSIVRLEIHTSMPELLRTMLMEEMDLTAADVYEANGILSLRDLMTFLEIPLPDLKDPPCYSSVPQPLRDSSKIGLDSTEQEDNLFAIIRKQDLMVHHPYHSFSRTVQRFITEAAEDPDVLAIKMTLYRTSGDSPIVQALITAAENGKQVAALVEIKARFDEENNINWARKLESAGVHVIYGLAGLKTHTKVVLVVRREEGRIRRYVHVGTGNYNPKTSRIYTDIGLLSCREDLGADLSNLFNYLTGYSRHHTYRKLLVAPSGLRNRMTELINREAAIARQGHHARIVAKMNALVDPKMIATLYHASQAGVQIDLIVRGMCCLRPGVAGVSDNIRVISIVGRFLEHSRIFYFHNQGQEEIFIGSADWMTRNLDRRVEAVVPIEDPEIAKDLQEILGIMLTDNRQAWDLLPDGRYIQRHPVGDSPEQNSQKNLMEIT
ncbi:polyphosphate kinase 1 [Phormidium sp. CLA17]|uniref:polyphosphate kinase 1 n=1 Tax=Leptolyngbya sp. Cla-17 TaxID=2803751 RepID=UPI001492B9E6|nr:polyphosphate kinase 1 [Leptolyngbya sp. Cla-17]MBM0740114.1 polyphosphate kinase 1 [Leptolyngbya sp. Cla-17]